MILRRRFFSISALLIATAFAQQKGLETLLPPVGPEDPWQPADEPMRYDAPNLYNFINGGAEVYLEYGFVQVVSQEYLRDEDSVVCTIYEMKDPAAAYGIFSYNRTPQKQALAIGDGGFKGGFQLAFWQDRYYVLVESYSQGEEIESALLDFAGRISKRIQGHAREPDAVSEMPQDHLIAGSVKLLEGPLALGSLLFLGTPDLFSLDGPDQVLFGEYGSLEDRAKLFLVMYAEPGKAERTYPRVLEILNAHSDYRALPPRASGASWVRQDRHIALARVGNTLALVTEARSRETAESILAQCGK